MSESVGEWVRLCICTYSCLGDGGGDDTTAPSEGSLRVSEPCHESVSRKSVEPLSTQYRSGVSYPVLPRRDQRGQQNQTSNRQIQ